ILPSAGLAIRCFRELPTQPTDVETLDLRGLKVYPNPSTNWFTIKWNDTEIQEGMELIICNLNGQEIKREKALSSNQQFDVSDLKPSMYLIHLKVNNQYLYTQKLVVMH